MKELSVEEKAALYDEVMERAKNYLNDCPDRVDAKGCIEYLLPSLKESEDEKIKEQVVYAIKQLHVCECTKNKLLAWVKKQGEQKPADKVEPDDLIEESYQQQADDLIDMVTGKPVWSEEDETKIKSIIALLKSSALCAMDCNKGIIDESIKYLKSIKDRVQPQPKQEWSEEDEHTLSKLLSLLLTNHPEMWAMFGNWLKCLKERYTWKPSEEQLIQLSNASNGLYYNCETLLSLLEQLKKLREE